MPNVENDQVFLMKEITQKGISLDIPVESYIVWGDDFNFCFDIEIEAYDGNPTKNVKISRTS